MSDRELLEEHLERLSPVIGRCAEVVTPEDVGQDYMLHISTNTAIKEFIPVIGFRQAKTEDRTVPRVCVAKTLLGCFAGYASASSDFINLSSDGKSAIKYKGGYQIYAIPFTACLAPNKKLVYDAELTEEHWLVAYSQETSKYVPEKAGKVFFNTITFVGHSGERSDQWSEMFVEVTKEGGIKFTPYLHLDKGFWKVSTEGPNPGQDVNKTKKKATAEEITKAEYAAAKSRCAALLNFTEPSYMGW